jgi:sugar phosphate isomerase/epimerase
LLSRRSCIGGGLAILASTQIAKAWSLPTRFPVGVQLYSVGDQLQRDVPGTLKRLKAIGYQRVETAGLARLTARQFRTQLDAAGLICKSTHLQALADRELNVLFDDAHALGAGFVVSSAIFAPGSAAAPDAEDYRVMAGHINDLASKAKRSELQYAYHNHNFEFRKLKTGQTGYDVLLDRFDPALVSLEMDCGWVVEGGYRPADLFARYPGRYSMLHIKDFAGGDRVVTSLAPGERPQGTELGRGHIDYKPILAAAAKAGIHDFYVEQEPPFPDMKPLEAMEVDFDYLAAL